MKRADRRELAVLGLVVLAWGLLVAPLLHRETHVHGQGYADTNFIIPEVVERVELTKGTSFASQGDSGRCARLAPSSDGSFQGCEDVNFTPAYPFTMRVTATLFL